MIVGLVSAYYAQPYADKNQDLISILITVFTVFAGFLIAIIAIVGDPVMIPDGSWRIAEGGRDRMQYRLTLYTALFALYLVAIGLLFVGVILEKAFADDNVWKIWIERAYLFIGVTSFLFTFALPGALLEMQSARYDAEIERRRRKAGIKPNDEDGVS